MDKPWKQAERDAAKLIGGRRFWANAGESIDCESDAFVAQVKNVKSLSLKQLTDLCISIEQYGSGIGKNGLVITKLRAGRGNKTPMIVHLTADTFSNICPDLEIL
jgi:hypothetical protein